MTTKRLTDIGIGNIAATPGQRHEIWDAIVPGLGVRIGGRRKTFVAMVRARGRLRVTLGVHPGLGVAEARTKARLLIEQAHNGVDPVEARHAREQQQEKQRRNTVAAAVEDYISRYAHCTPQSSAISRAWSSSGGARRRRRMTTLEHGFEADERLSAGMYVTPATSNAAAQLEAC